MLHASHGEVNFFEFKKRVPKNARKIYPKNGQYRIAESEVTGNHHVIEAKDGVSLYEYENLLYMVNKTSAIAKCVIESRHDAIEIPCGTWEIEPSYEYDYLTEEIRICRD